MGRVAVIFRSENEVVLLSKESNALFINEKVNAIINSGLLDYVLIIINDYFPSNTFDRLAIFKNQTKIEVNSYKDGIEKFATTGDNKGTQNIPREVVGRNILTEEGAGKNFSHGIDWAERDTSIDTFVVIYNFEGFDEIFIDRTADFTITDNYIVLTRKTRNALGVFNETIFDETKAVQEYVARARLAEMKEGGV